MTRSIWLRISAVLVLLLFLTPALFAAPRKARQVQPERGAFAWLAQVLERFLPATLKSSGTMDPDGKPTPAAPPASAMSDSSGTMDPDGRN